MSTLTAPQIVLRPVISEKTIDESGRGKYTFAVHDKANKIQIKQAIEKLAGSDISPDTIREAIKGQEMIAPQGKIRLEKENLHTWLWPKIAVAKSDGQFEILKDSAEWKAPDPYAAYPNQKCTEAGLKEI